jgi:hypothetical protein
VSNPPFTLKIFVPDGDPDGLRIVDRTNWNGKALVFPRAAWAQPSVADRPELQQTGVYLLLGPREDGEGDRLYIGEGDPIKPRSASHHSGSAQKVFWSRAMCFVSMGHALNKAYVLAMLPVVGRSANRRVDWKDPQGRSLNALQNMN